MFASAIVGAGPGGTGPLVFAAQAGLLDSWLSLGVAVIDRARAFGGTIGRYVINSDTLGGVYLECLSGPAARAHFEPLLAESVTQELRSMANGYPPLPLVGSYFNRLGALLERAVTANPSSAFFGRAETTSLHLCSDGSIAIKTKSGGVERTVRARTAVLALGGQPNVGGTSLPRALSSQYYQHKLISSDDLLTSEGLARAQVLLSRSRRPNAIILGGSHSAYSAAWALLNRVPDVSFDNDAITILGRHDPKVFYPSRADAHTDRYEFAEDDICPRTQRVNRMAGLRGDGRELWRQMSSRPGSPLEGRVKSVLCESLETVPVELFDDAAVIVKAFGYSARTVPVFDVNGHKLRLRGNAGGPAVDDDARILLCDGRGLRNVFGIGLGSGYRPRGAMGGEPNFRGQANSLWLYQNDIGAKVYAGVQEYLERSSQNLIREPTRKRASGTR